MPKYTVMVSRIRTIESSVEIDVSARDEGAAVEKITDRIDKAQMEHKLEALDWDVSGDDDSFEYDASKA